MRPHRKRTARQLAALLLAAAAFSGPVLAAQQRLARGSSLLALDVSVFDRDGNPVSDLSPADFIVTLNNETQPVRTLVFMQTPPQRATKVVRLSAFGSPPPVVIVEPSGEPESELFVLTIDALSIYLQMKEWKHASGSAIYRIGVDVSNTLLADSNYIVAVTVNRPGVRVLTSR